MSVNQALQNKIQISLFLMRVSIFLVMFVWTVDKFTDTNMAIQIYEAFYFIGGVSTEIMLALGAIEMVLILAFVAGLWKNITYSAVLVLHGISTLSSWKQYINMELLFYAAWPMFAGCIMLYLLRDLDTKFILKLPEKN
ncbi:hypothetical protein [Pseudemcibacter aquimaris]|uniref:hypothetical protein n=1 Tax=Pseudemcibacter aquimaris TaxID=2857064 RepID=UPI0020138392|nr:hypothetical protein [Pseudemcibacter aquimaris]MCC3862007.1 hypothetical protein [Pseudemcibacter aquimaris]WDU58759.1 hypothetical protein KW060_00540 [Pseudemcibacter aquimaris]